MWAVYPWAERTLEPNFLFFRRERGRKATKNNILDREHAMAQMEHHAPRPSKGNHLSSRFQVPARKNHQQEGGIGYCAESPFHILCPDTVPSLSSYPLGTH